eukprot:430059_1
MIKQMMIVYIYMNVMCLIMNFESFSCDIFLVYFVIVFAIRGVSAVCLSLPNDIKRAELLLFCLYLSGIYIFFFLCEKALASFIFYLPLFCYYKIYVSLEPECCGFLKETYFYNTIGVYIYV